MTKCNSFCGSAALSKLGNTDLTPHDRDGSKLHLQLERDIVAAERQLACLEKQNSKYQHFSMYSERRFVKDDAGKHGEVKRYQK